MVALSSFASQYLLLMGQQSTIAPYASTAGGGSLAPVYGTPKTYPCYFVREPTQIINREGDIDLSNAQVNIYPQATDGTLLTLWDDRARVTLPDGTTPVVKRADVLYDFDGDLILYVIYT